MKWILIIVTVTFVSGIGTGCDDVYSDQINACATACEKSHRSMKLCSASVCICDTAEISDGGVVKTPEQ